jgi:multidrug efflux pump subunit AcrA (membrane-fusion protein)
MNAFLALLAIASLGQVSEAPPLNDLTVPASITPQRDIRISAEAEGLITELRVREGTRINAGDIVALIDDRRAKAAVEIARLQKEAAFERSTDDVEKRYAMAAAAVALKKYEAMRSANQGRSGAPAVSPIELEQLRLDFERAKLQIEKAEKDQLLAAKDADAKKAEEEAARIALEQRSIFSKFDGEVQQIFIHESEWVNPGDPILRLVQFDVMNVDCTVSLDDYDPSELEGRPVTVRINLARGRQLTVQGRVIWASQVAIEGYKGIEGLEGLEGLEGFDASYAGRYQVRAEVPNVREGDFWRIRPGLTAEMTIHMSEPPVETSAQNAALAP